MPCMGAEQPTPEEVDRVLAATLEFLKTQYGVFVMPEIKPVGDDEFAKITAEYHQWRRKGREEAIAKLKDAIAEVLFQRNCEEW